MTRFPLLQLSGNYAFLLWGTCSPEIDMSQLSRDSYVCVLCLDAADSFLCGANYLCQILTTVRHELSGREKEGHLPPISPTHGVALFYGAAMYTYTCCHTLTTGQNKTKSSLCSTILTPMLNPLIYSFEKLRQRLELWRGYWEVQGYTESVREYFLTLGSFLCKWRMGASLTNMAMLSERLNWSIIQKCAGKNHYKKCVFWSCFSFIFLSLCPIHMYSK